jgi:hypothetical protein
MDLRFYIHQNLQAMGGFELRVRDNETGAFVEHSILKQRKRFEYVAPCAILSEEALQELFNQLWKEGFRPKDGTGNSGHLEAINRHLEDMRTLVFKTKGTK